MTTLPSRDDSTPLDLNFDKDSCASSALLHTGALKLLKGDFRGVYATNADPQKNISSYLKSASHGNRAVKQAVEALFDGSTIDHKVDKDDRDKLHKFIEEGGLNQQLQAQPQMMAAGGLASALEAKPALAGTDAMAQALPEHNMMLQSAKTRINGYLNSIRPTKEFPQHPFDEIHEDPAKKHVYEKALDLANAPLSIFNHMKDGSLTMESLAHFKGLYPEGHDHLSKKMTERIVKAQLDGKKPPYKTRQAMALFLGADLDSTFSPQSIAAAQAVFSQTQAPPQQQIQQKKNKKGASSLGKAASGFRTSEQASEAREQKST